MSEPQTVRMCIGQDLPRRPGCHRPPAWWQRCGLVLVILFMTAVRGDGHADVPASGAASAQFVTIVLGAAGGLHEANLTSYLLAPIGERRFVALDAGTVLSGLQVAMKMGSFADIQAHPASALTLEGLILREHIKAYALSHAHLDHISGLILNAPDDSPKPILGLDATLIPYGIMCSTGGSGRTLAMKVASRSCGNTPISACSQPRPMPSPARR